MKFVEKKREMQVGLNIYQFTETFDEEGRLYRRVLNYMGPRPKTLIGTDGYQYNFEDLLDPRRSL